MRVDPGPLTWDAVLATWHLDVVSVTVVVVLAVGYAWCYRRIRNSESSVRAAHAGCFGVGILVWLLATVSAIGAYAYVVFWVRALQVLLLLYVAPFLIAQAKPVTVLRDALGPAGRDRWPPRGCFT